MYLFDYMNNKQLVEKEKKGISKTRVEIDEENRTLYLHIVKTFKKAPFRIKPQLIDDREAMEFTLDILKYCNNPKDLYHSVFLYRTLKGYLDFAK